MTRPREVGDLVRLEPRLPHRRELRVPGVEQTLVVGEDAELDAQRFRRTDNGVVLVTKSMIDRLIT